MATKTQPLTLQQIIVRHATDIAFAAEEQPATTPDDFLDQLRTAAHNLGYYAGINGAEDLDTAAMYLDDARHAGTAEQPVLLKRANRNLKYLADMVDEYRLMV